MVNMWMNIFSADREWAGTCWAADPARASGGQWAELWCPPQGPGWARLVAESQPCRAASGPTSVCTDEFTTVPGQPGTAWGASHLGPGEGDFKTKCRGKRELSYNKKSLLTQTTITTFISPATTPLVSMSFSVSVLLLKLDKDRIQKLSRELQKKEEWLQEERTEREKLEVELGNEKDCNRVNIPWHMHSL